MNVTTINFLFNDSTDRSITGGFNCREILTSIPLSPKGGTEETAERQTPNDSFRPEQGNTQCSRERQGGGKADERLH